MIGRYDADILGCRMGGLLLLVAEREQMQDDEARHADHAQAQGARTLPQPVPTLMALASKLMKTVAYRI